MVGRIFFKVIAGLWLVLLSACGPSVPPLPPPTPTPTPIPAPTLEATPTPKPTPEPTPYVPRKPMSTGMLFNGLQYHWNVQTEEGDTAVRDRIKDDSYRIELNLKIRTPRPATTMEDMRAENAHLPKLIPSLPTLLETAKVSPAYESLYKRKLDWLKGRLEKIEQILSRHNYYDCDTILNMQYEPTQRRVIFVQGDMDLNVDGSDGDRNIKVDGSGQFFQPQTSYRWRKTTERPNPFLSKYEKQITDATKELSDVATTAARKVELRKQIDVAKRQIADLKSYSFLVSKADPTVVLPGFMMRGEGPDVPKFGDYVVVIHEGKMYPAILGDAGPSHKMGEASLRLGNEIKDMGTPLARPVSDLAVTYLVFPRSADAQRSVPDLDHWWERCRDLLIEIGIPDPPLHRWENVVQPWPTPTPTPTPEPLPLPESSPAIESSEVPAKEVPQGIPSPTPMPMPQAEASEGSTSKLEGAAYSVPIPTKAGDSVKK